MEVGTPEETERKLAEIRGMYEPYVYTLSQYLYVELPSVDQFRAERPPVIVYSRSQGNVEPGR